MWHNTSVETNELVGGHTALATLTDLVQMQQEDLQLLLPEPMLQARQ